MKNFLSKYTRTILYQLESFDNNQGNLQLKYSLDKKQ